ncbi:MAG: GHKL domain-containing protein [Firmicutes bacterium]|nr:GHKL domain-containing protein [Bacillota bacterium]
MKKKLIRNNIILLLSAFVLFFVVVFIALYQFEKNNQTQFMSYIIDEVEIAYQNHTGDATDFISSYSNDNGRRITILDPDALVLADTHDSVIGTDKSERPEIVDLGSVYVRHSATIDLDMLYIAKLMDDGNYLRVAVPLADQAVAYNRVVWILIMSGAGLLILYYVGLKEVNKNLLTPWQQVKKGMISLNQGKFEVFSLNSPYPEINDILHEMNGINLETAKHVRTIQAYQMQLNSILNEIKQGVILLDHQENIIYVNEDAKVIFDLNDDALNRPAYYALRNPQIKEAISTANLDRKSSTFDLKHKGRIYESRIFFVSSDQNMESETTVLALFKDVSQERSIEQMKRDFFAHASHELKSPLTAIRGYAELIEHGLVNNQEIPESALQIVKQTETMTALVEDMLMLSRLESLKEKLFTKQDLKAILMSVIEQMKPIYKQKKIEIHVESEPVQMMCDLLDIQKLFKNLIENSIKYSEENKKIDIKLYLDKDSFVFDIKDQGIGIDLEHQQRVFERFYRVDKGRLEGGTGLGLAIVKHIVMKYQGDIHLESGLSKGTHIIIRINLNQNN